LYLKLQVVPSSKHPVWVIKTIKLTLSREMVAGAPDVHTKHMNEYTVWEENIPTVTLGGKYAYGKCYTLKG